MDFSIFTIEKEDTSMQSVLRFWEEDLVLGRPSAVTALCIILLLFLSCVILK